MIVLEIMILIVLWLMSCAVSAAISFFYAKKQKHYVSLSRAMTEEEKRQAEKEQRELENFWSYTGDPQDNDINR